MVDFVNVIYLCLSFILLIYIYLVFLKFSFFIIIIIIYLFVIYQWLLYPVSPPASTSLCYLRAEMDFMLMLIVNNNC